MYSEEKEMEMEIEKLEIFKAPDKNDFLDIIE